MQKLNWDEYFMSIAYLSSMRSKDPRTKVGACIIDKNNRIISTGYNGMPNGCSDEEMPWGLNAGLDNKHFYVVHAELNAILNSKKDLSGCKLYTTLFPCNECAKAIIQSDIKQIFYISDKYKDNDKFKSSRLIFEKTGIELTQLISDKILTINLKDTEVNYFDC